MTSANPIPQAVIGCDVGKTSIVVFDSRGGRTRPSPTSRNSLPFWRPASMPPASSSARRPAATRHSCLTPWRRLDALPTAPMPARSRPSFAPSAPSARRMRLMRARTRSLRPGAPRQPCPVAAQRRRARPAPCLGHGPARSGGRAHRVVQPRGGADRRRRRAVSRLGGRLPRRPGHRDRRQDRRGTSGRLCPQILFATAKDEHNCCICERRYVYECCTCECQYAHKSGAGAAGVTTFPEVTT